MGYSQKEVAKILGHRDQSQICNWEKGVKRPNLDNILKLSALYRVPVEYLFFNLFQSLREELRAREEKIFPASNIGV